MNAISIASKAQVDALIARSSSDLSEVTSATISLQKQEDVSRIIQSCPNLASLSLIQCDCDDEGFRQMTRCGSNIVRLVLFKLDKISDQGLGYLAELPNLHRVKIGNLLLVSESGLQHLLTDSSSLKKISVFLAYRLNGYAIRSLLSGAQMPSQITMIGNDVTDELAEAVLKANPNTERLAIRCSGVSVDFVRRLLADTKDNKIPLALKKLKVVRTRIKPTDLTTLQALLPNVEIVIR